MASEGFTYFKHLPLDIIALHDALLIMSILLFSRLFVYLLLTILLLYLTKSHVCWSCTKRRKKADKLYNRGPNSIELSYEKKD